MVMFATFNIILDPVRETGMVPVKEQRSVGLPSDFGVTKPTVWSLVVQRRIDLANEQPQDDTLLSAVTVTPLWRKPDGGPSCTGITDQTLQLQDIESVFFDCPPSQPIPKESSTKLLPLPYQYSQPDLLVSVNFTLLNISSDSLEDIPLNSVQIMLGLTANAKDIVRTTVPTTLIPGVNLIGIANLAVRQKFSTPGLSALGVLDVSHTPCV
ncbi:hypothetical protein CPB83DRAFT_517246 [Crepidotus variabilis]|uniref:Uncharacterized protein n=1 Tax=Crepidotus variabilis TaxID=179855 RepID=A0A9P6EB75_9AGAR|nr:hypothetical protein CPB83DRAFT_517246 [Crepidotus variabilis]